MLLSKRLWLALVVAAWGGTAPAPAAENATRYHHGAPTKHARIEIYDALKAAVVHLRKGHRLRERYTLNAAYDSSTRNWVFTFRWQPNTPDNEVIVTVSDSGHVKW